MFLELKNRDLPELKNRDWRPEASISAIKARADILKLIREFFASRGILEVETPLLCAGVATDPHLKAIETCISFSDKKEVQKYYLQTSPEFAMKRLLAAKLGSIFQICKAFRDSEVGRFHNPEFTILEWYRMHFNHFQLMDEVEDLLKLTLNTNPAKKISYEKLFLEKIHINPHEALINELKNKALELGFAMDKKLVDALDKDDWLNILMTHFIEPTIGFNEPLFVYDFPASQAALSKVTMKNGKEVAERFEVYIQGIEVANGYHELIDHHIQLERFLNDIKLREQYGKPSVPIDHCLIEALKEGVADCAGIALGIDRLLMIKLGVDRIQDVLTFSVERA